MACYPYQAYTSNKNTSLIRNGDINFRRNNKFFTSICKLRTYILNCLLRPLRQLKIKKLLVFIKGEAVSINHWARRSVANAWHFVLSLTTKTLYLFLLFAPCCLFIILKCPSWFFLTFVLCRLLVIMVSCQNRKWLGRIVDGYWILKKGRKLRQIR